MSIGFMKTFEKQIARAKDFRPISDNSGKASSSIGILIIFLLGIGLTLFVIINPMKVGLFDKARQLVVPQAETAAPSAPQPAGKKVLYWKSTMTPGYISNKPGKDSMGMDLVPVYEGEQETGNVIKIDAATVQNIGVVSEPVKRGDLKFEVRTVGTLDYNQKNFYLVNTKYDGWIQKVHVNYVGQGVRKGEPLFEIYSPDLVSTQEEYLSAVRYRDKMKASAFPDAENRANSLLAASRSRLLNWDISEGQIRRLEENGQITKTLTVVSPATGVVVEKMDKTLEGMYATAGMDLYKIADLSSLWVYVDIYEYQLPWVKPGQEAEVEISFYPGEVFTGKTLFSNPFIDEKTRTIRVNLEIPNKDGRLRPQMFATVTFSPVMAKDVVLVPEIAVLHTGERNVVVVDLGDGKFEPRDVKLGLQGSGMYQVLEGVREGEKIVISAQFLIDSESDLREAINKMLIGTKAGAAMPAPEAATAPETEQTPGTEQTPKKEQKPGTEQKSTMGQMPGM